MLHINQKIVGWNVVLNEAAAQEEKYMEVANVVVEEAKPSKSLADSSPLLQSVKHPIVDIVHDINERMDRPEALYGRTYKIKTPVLDYSLYVTINDLVLNPGTDFETRRPFEVFVNSKNMESFQWIVALTRVMSAVFRKGGDVKFLVDELKVIFDPRGGYFKPGGDYMPSVVAEMGYILERHLARNEKQYAIKAVPVDLSQVKRQDDAASQGGQFPSTAELCTKCMAKSVMVLDGCQTCLNCGASKCG